MIFVSYSSSDESSALEIVRLLEAKGYLCWLASRDIPVSANFAEKIIEAIDECSAIVVIISEQAMQSPHVIRELERAVSKRKSIVPVVLDDVHLTSPFEYLLSVSQFIRLPSNRLEESIGSVIAGLGAEPEPREPIRSSASPPPADLQELLPDEWGNNLWIRIQTKVKQILTRSSSKGT